MMDDVVVSRNIIVKLVDVKVLREEGVEEVCLTTWRES